MKNKLLTTIITFLITIFVTIASYYILESISISLNIDKPIKTIIYTILDNNKSNSIENRVNTIFDNVKTITNIKINNVIKVINIIGSILMTLSLLFFYFLIISLYKMISLQEALYKNENIINSLPEWKEFHKENASQYTKEINKIQNMLHWNGKVEQQNDYFHKSMWIQLKKAYLYEETKNIKDNKIVTNLNYYPNITKLIFKSFLDTKDEIKFTLVSTMPPDYYFNYPGKINNKQIKYKHDFIDEYRKSLVSIVKKINDNDNVDFNRFTLLSPSSEELDSNIQNKTDIINQNEFCKLKNQYLKEINNSFVQEDLVNHPDCIEDKEKNFDNNLKFYEIKEDGSISVLDYYINRLHAKNSKSKVIILQKNTIKAKLKLLNFLRIQKGETAIYIHAELDIKKKIAIINIDSSEDKLIEDFYNYLVNNDSSIDIKTFL